jgi:hypothetical protein
MYPGNKYVNKIKESKRTIIFLGEGIKKKINNCIKGDKIKNIRELCESSRIFGDDVKQLFTLSDKSMFPPSKKDELVKKIRELLTTLKTDLDIDIPKKVENILTNIEILDEDEDDERIVKDLDDENDENDEKQDDTNYTDNSDGDSDSNSDNNSDNDIDEEYDYIFEDDTFKIKSFLINNDDKKSELKAIILSYILENINPNERIEFIKHYITDKQGPSWSILNIFKRN